MKRTLTADDYFGYFQTVFNLVEGTEGWYRFNDPFDPKARKKNDRTLAVNFQEFRVRSFRREYKASIQSFIMAYEGISFYDIPKLLSEFNAIPLPIVSQKLIYHSSAPTLELPKGFASLGNATDKMGIQAVEYLEGRGLPISYLIGKNVGYCKYGKDGGYLCFPFYDSKGELEFYVLRDFIGQKIRYKNLKAGTCKKNAGQVIYNSSRLNYSGDVYITEGIIDSLTIGDDSVATIGKEITLHQISMLCQSKATRFIVMGDPNAKVDNLVHFARVAAHKPLYVVDFTPLGGDVNKVGRDAAMAHVATGKLLDTKSFTF